MPNKRATKLPEDKWMSLIQGQQTLARPVRVSVSREHIDLHGCQHPLHQRQAKNNQPQQFNNQNPQSVSADQYMRALSQATLSQIKYKSVTAPHPLLNDGKPLSSEAVAHYVLFSEMDDLLPLSAVVLSCPVAEVAKYIGFYIELLLTKGLEGEIPENKTDWAAHVSTRASGYCKAVLEFTGICLNSQSLSALLNMVSTLGTVDAQQAESLKREVATAQINAQARIKHAAPTSETNKADLANVPSGYGENGKSLSNADVSSRLRNEGVTVGLMLEPGFAEIFAGQIAYFHRSIWHNWNPIKDPSLAFQSSYNSSMYKLNPLMFDYAENPHFLSNVFTQTVFSPGIGDVQRARLLEKWIIVAHELYSLGDFVGWCAVILNIYDTACLRLSSTWTLVDSKYIKNISRDWESECFEINKRSAMQFLSKTTFRHTEPHIGQGYNKQEAVPYFVDVIVREGLPGNSSGSNGVGGATIGVQHAGAQYGDISLIAKQLQRLDAISASWQAYFSQLPDFQGPTKASMIKPDEAFQGLFSKLALNTDKQQNDLISLSQNIQPKFMGYYLSSFYHQVLPLTAGCIIPVLFTSSMNTFCLFPRSTLLMATLPKQSNKSHSLRRSSSFPSAVPPQITGVTELDYDARERLENTVCANALAVIVRDLLNVGTHTIETPASIVFKSLDGLKNVSTPDNGKRPLLRRNSRTSSIIETLNKRASFKRNSGISHHPQSQGVEPATSVVCVKSASLVRLVDVMVLGAGVFSPGNNLDTTSHIETLLATYRSFCSPAELIDMIQMCLKCCRGASKRLSEASSFPMNDAEIERIWQPSQPSDKVDIWAVTILNNIIEFLSMWVSNYFFDFTDDTFTMIAGKSLITSIVNEVKSVDGYPEELTLKVGKLHGSFWRHYYTRTDNSFLKSKVAVFVQKSPADQLPVIQLQTVKGLNEINVMIDELDSIIAETFRNITLCDWMKLFELLELQASKRTGLFTYNSQSGASESDTVIQDVYSWIKTLQSSTLPNTLVMELLPESISFLVRLHSSLVVYFATQICDPGIINSSERRERMVILLMMLGILQGRMKSLSISEVDSNQQETQHIPSFLESALMSAILLPESRAYANSWLIAGQEVANMFPLTNGSGNAYKHGHHHSLDRNTPSVLPSDTIPNHRSVFVPSVPIVSDQPVTICPGWIMDRFLEIVCCVPNISIENPMFINFDKSRYAFNLVKNMCGDLQDRTVPPPSDSILAKYGFLLLRFTDNRYAAVPPFLFDRKAVKEAVGREGKIRQKIFIDVVNQEMDKSKAEAKQYDRLERYTANGPPSGALSSLSFYGLPASQSSTSLSLRRASRIVPSPSVSDVSSIMDSSSDTINTNLNHPSSYTPGKRPNGTQKRSRLGGLFKSVRPLSVLGGYGNNVPTHGGANANNSSGSQISNPQPQSSSNSFYRQRQDSTISLADDTSLQGFTVHSQGSQSSFTHNDQQHQLNQLQQLQNMHNVKSSSVSQLNPDEDELSPWTEDSLIDLASMPSFSDINNDSWNLIHHIDLMDIVSVKPISLTTSQIIFKSGKESETIIIRASKPDEAQEWLQNVTDLKSSCLMKTTRVFGIPLQIVCMKEKRDIPALLETLLSRIEDVGLTEVGIYRISGSLGAINNMKSWFDSGKSTFKTDDPKWNDINAVAGCIKLYLRELPESLMTFELLPEFLSTVNSEGVDINAVRQVLAKLPKCNYMTLRRLIHHLRLIVLNSEANKMNVQNIAIVFGVNFLPPVEIKQMGVMQNLVKALVEQFDQVFSA